jgi:hypothetical protein
MTKFILLTFLSFTTFTAVGQHGFRKNDIYLEAGGNGLFGSLSYERQLTKEPGLAARIGIGFYTENDFFLTLPVGVNYLLELKKKNTFIDAGFGVTWALVNGKFSNDPEDIGENFTSFIPSIGYRKHTAKNIMWRISLTPVINKHDFIPWLGLSIGKRF